MAETDYAIKSAAWKLLDPANPAFRPVGFEDHGKNMQATAKVRPDESAEQYWARVRREI